MPDFTDLAALDSFLKAEMAAEQALISSHQAYLLKLSHIAELVPGFNDDSSSSDASSPSSSSSTDASSSDGSGQPTNAGTAPA